MRITLIRDVVVLDAGQNTDSWGHQIMGDAVVDKGHMKTMLKCH